MTQGGPTDVSAPPAGLFETRRSLLWGCILVTLTIAAFSAGSALVANDMCSGDGSFSLDDPGARVSGYCKATHLPGFPDSLGSGLLLAAIFLTPTVTALLGSNLAVRRNRPAVLRIAAIAAAVLFVASFLLIAAFANVEYHAPI
jgi:hypothetical protein